MANLLSLLRERYQISAVFYCSLLITLLVSIWGLAWPNAESGVAWNLSDQSAKALSFATGNFGWFFLLSVFAYLIVSFYLLFGPYRYIRLGKDDEPPEYAYFSWLAMLFAAGMGIGLVFWGVSEPLYHFLSPPMNLAPAQSPEAGRLALKYAFFHWGLHPWAIYSLMALSIAYFHFRKGESTLISSSFRPILGSRIDGPIGQIIDTLATVATVFGVATSLGLGTLQIAGGLHHLFNLPNTSVTWTWIILIVTTLYLASAITGLNKGILYLSNTNMAIAGFLLAFVFLLGPTQFIVDAFTTVTGDYLSNLLPMSFRLTPFTQGKWAGSWTLFYWAWWIAWAPFVGSFIARISKGRTIQEFVATVMILPTLLCALWFSAFGGGALHHDLFQDGTLAQSAASDVTTTLFLYLELFPWGKALALLAGILVATFFITSADSATFVLGMLTTQGSPNPKIPVKLVWAFVQSSLALALLLSGGESGLKTMQTASIVAALPFSLILLLMAFSLLKALKTDPKTIRH